MSASRLLRAVCALFFLPLLAQYLPAQTNGVISVEDEVVKAHRITKRPIIHQQLPPRYTSLSFIVRVVVNSSGEVESVQPENPVNVGEKWAFDEAIKAEKLQRFRPFTKKGTPVKASFHDFVWIVPPVQWASPRVPFPNVRDWDSLRIRLRRTGCYGSCAVYSVEVRGDGEVLFDGTQNVLAIGHHRSRVSFDAVAGLVAAFRKADYFSLKDEYAAMITDNSTCFTSIEFDGQKKSVKDYVGFAAGMPEIVTDLENEIDRVAGVDKWIAETPETASALFAENPDFQIDTPENLTLFAQAIQWNAKSVVDLFLRHGALASPKAAAAILGTAARAGNYDLVSRIIREASSLPQSTLNCALGSAAASGSLPTVRLLIASGAEVNGPPCPRGEPPLIAAAESGDPALVDEILKYDPDVNAKDYYGETALSTFLKRSLYQSHARQVVVSLINAGADVNVRSGDDEETPIFHACDLPGVLPLLIKAGADVNARDRFQETPLMECSEEDDGLKALLAAGADPSLRDVQGKTAADQAREDGDQKAAALLEAAAEAQKQVH